MSTILEEYPSHRQLRKHVAEQIRSAILTGQFKPGEWLRQEKLAQELNVSQMPVREALKELVADGLVEHVPYRGARVVEFVADDVMDLYEHRAFLEGRAAEFATRHITDDELKELKDMADVMATLPAEKIADYRKINRDFHTLIFHASRRKYLIRTLRQMWEAFPTMLIGNFAITAQNPLPEREFQDQQEHLDILAALTARDGTRARDAMQAHILSTAKNLVQSLKANR